MRRLTHLRWFIVLEIGLGLALSAYAVADEADSRVWAENYSRKTIYHSAQKPGYTCWAGEWQMPDGALMVTFKEATGPVRGRPQAKAQWREAFWLNKADPARDFTGLHLADMYLRSVDGGSTWTKVGEAAYSGPVMGFAWGGSHCALEDGTILRAVDGSAAPGMELPRRVFFQRSVDLGKTWGPPEIPPEPVRPVADYIGDFGDCISRVRRLRDGRIVASGVKRFDPSPAKRTIGEPVVMLADPQGRKWEPIRIELKPEQRGPGVWDEWDGVELADRTFLCVFRRGDPKRNNSKEVRWQGLLRENGDRWALEEYRPAPFEHSGHPELLATREGVVLHIATDGIYWTDDVGKSWHRLAFKGLDRPYRSCYYPRSIQAADGTIYVLSHQGSDDPYGKNDQAIIMDRFRLVVKAR
jgi:hypothetical protein